MPLFSIGTLPRSLHFLSLNYTVAVRGGDDLLDGGGGGGGDDGCTGARAFEDDVTAPADPAAVLVVDAAVPDPDPDPDAAAAPLPLPLPPLPPGPLLWGWRSLTSWSRRSLLRGSTKNSSALRFRYASFSGRTCVRRILSHRMGGVDRWVDWLVCTYRRIKQQSSSSHRPIARTSSMPMLSMEGLKRK